MADTERLRIRVIADGPYAIEKGISVRRQTIVADPEGESVEWREGEACTDGDACTLCRCGHSCRKPFCDGSHADAVWDSRETASHEAYADVCEVIEGPRLSLTDVPALCAEARFCHRAGGAWNLVSRSDDPTIAEVVVDEAEKCPSGRYVALDTMSGAVHEPDLEPSVGVVEDPQKGVSGPLWVRGGISVAAADGSVYEARNRMTLCRCGHSSNKPFCDGSHVATGFREEHH